ncbi:pectate lyase family protein [Pedobacter hiemivivus]|nr:pectate lyase [Pedobacter hiemivivus]
MNMEVISKRLLLSSVMLLIIFSFTNCEKKKKADLIPSKEEDKGTLEPKPITETAYAFPGAEGFGRNATGGRGGKIIKVTNLNDAGAGSLRAAVEATGPRIVVFDISGTIALKSRLVIKNKDITIAGQTAPGDGICLRNYEVNVGADNVIVRYMRFRMGDTEQQEGDAFGGRFQKNIIVDHCSMSWSTDECVSFYANENFTLQWCLITESLRNSVHGKGAHGYGGVWGGKYASFHHNLMANHDSRNPRFGEEAGKAFALTDLVDMRNNVFYNWGPTNNAYGGEGMNVNVINNYYKPGPATTKKERIISIDKNKIAGTEVYNIWGKFYITGNYVNEGIQVTNDNWTYGVYNQFHSSYGTISDADRLAMKLNIPLAIDNNVTTHTALQAYDKVMDYAGAVLKRDPIDTRTVLHTRNKTFYKTGSNGSANGIIDTQTDVDGWPVLQSLPAQLDTDADGMPDDWEKSKGLDPKVANAGGRNLSTAYDNIEVYINSIVASITENQAKAQ